MSESFWTAIMVAILAPCLLALINGWQRRRDKKFDQAREDLVAQRVAAAAELLRHNTAAVAKSTADARSEASIAADRTQSQLLALARDTKIVHALVNSKLTVEMQASLDANRALLVAVRALNQMKKTHGDTLTDEDLAAEATIKAKITELELILKDRQEKQVLIDRQEKVGD